MKVGQLIEHNLVNIFLEKSYAKQSKKTSPRFKSISDFGFKF